MPIGAVEEPRGSVSGGRAVSGYIRRGRGPEPNPKGSLTIFSRSREAKMENTGKKNNEVTRRVRGIPSLFSEAALMPTGRVASTG